MRPDRGIGVAIVVLSLLPFYWLAQGGEVAPEPKGVNAACVEPRGELVQLCETRQAQLAHIATHRSGYCGTEEIYLRETEAKIEQAA